MMAVSTSLFFETKVNLSRGGFALETKRLNPPAARPRFDQKPTRCYLALLLGRRLVSFSYRPRPTQGG